MKIIKKTIIFTILKVNKYKGDKLNGIWFWKNRKAKRFRFINKKKIKDVADYLQDDKLKLNKANKLKVLKDLETIANDAYKILSEL